ncbi:hypothetical protein [Paenibacillus paeoniae]|uniref:Uncharacterized protein n=1 Tax=Paenibacillus paeoniae TaxID=2292705 RepID=A0A371PEG9_9BACL|nr:hypothetical protein [Paenibacillus paeoniae]REK74307.1 hypothetical protein DX130_17395 [Paenibacillus paeoniae]
MRLTKAIIIVLLLFIISFPMASSKAHAGMFDRLKDIYQAPDKLAELKGQYESTKQMLEGQLEAQREQLELTRQQASDLLAQQEALLAQQEGLIAEQEELLKNNEALKLDNQTLIAQMEAAEAKKQSLFSKAILIAVSLIAVLAAYALSVRIWRFVVWRKQRRSGHGHEAMLP